MATKRVSRKIKASPVVPVPPVPPPTLWQTMNEPISYASPQFGVNVLVIAALLLGFAWMQPYFGSADMNAGHVAGAYTSISEVPLPSEPPYWYAVGIPKFLNNVDYSTQQVLDISTSVQISIDYYSPGVNAVKDAWLELMADPPV